MRFLVALIAVLACAPMGGRAETLTMVADNWCPFNCDPNDTERLGFLVEIAKKTFEPLGYKVEYSIVPWARAKEEVRAGKYNMLIATNPEETPGFVFPSEPKVSCGFDAFARDDSAFVFTGASSLDGHTMGATVDYFYSDAVNGYMDAHKTETKRIQMLRGDNALELNIKKLLAGRFDVLFENEAVLHNTMKDMQPELERLGLAAHGVKKVGHADSKDQMCWLGFSPAVENSAKLARVLSDHVQAMRTNGELAKLQEKYGVK